MCKGDLYKLTFNTKRFTEGQLVKFILPGYNECCMVEDVNDAKNYGFVDIIDLEKVVSQEEKVVHPEEMVLKSLQKCALLT